MKKTYRKYKISVLSIVTAILLTTLFGCAQKSEYKIPERVIAEDSEAEFGNYKYMLYDDGTAVIMSYSGSEPYLTVPESINGHTVTEIYAEAFSENQSILSVKLNASLERIGDHAFYLCSKLGEITFGKKLTASGAYAFSETAWLASRTEAYVTVGDGLLIKYQGSKKDIVVPDYIKHIGSSVFENAADKIISVEMGDSVLSINSSAFAFCNNLRRVVIGKNTKYIGDGAFDGCEQLTSVKIPDSVEKIGGYAFNYCHMLSDVHIGKSVKIIDEYAFRNCLRLKSVVIPVSVEIIASYAFDDCYTLSTVFYTGSSEQYDKILIGDRNSVLNDAEKYYDYQPH